MSEPSKLVHLDQAKSGRSTCRATGDTIAKGEFRVGIEAYTGGHISMTWQVTWTAGLHTEPAVYRVEAGVSNTLFLLSLQHPTCCTLS